MKEIKPATTVKTLNRRVTTTIYGKDFPCGQFMSDRALEYARQAFQFAKEDGDNIAREPLLPGTEANMLRHINKIYGKIDLSLDDWFYIYDQQGRTVVAVAHIESHSNHGQPHLAMIIHPGQYAYRY